MSSHHTTERSDRTTRDNAPAWTANAFLAAGGFFAIFAVLWAVTAATDADPETLRNGFIGPVGWIFAFVGLLSLFFYRSVDRASWWSRVGAICAGIGALGAAVVAVTSLLQLIGVVGSRPQWANVLDVTIVLGIIPGFISFSAASFRAESMSRIVSILLAAPPVIFMLLVGLAAGIGPESAGADWVAVAAGSGQAIALLAIGFAVRNEGGRQPDTTAEAA